MPSPAGAFLGRGRAVLLGAWLAAGGAKLPGSHANRLVISATTGFELNQYFSTYGIAYITSAPSTVLPLVRSGRQPYYNGWVPALGPEIPSAAMSNPQAVSGLPPLEPQALLDLIAAMLAESTPPGTVAPVPRLDSRLDRELGLDSLSRAELLARLRARFGRELPDAALLAETPAQLLEWLEGRGGTAPQAEAPVWGGPTAEPMAGTPTAAKTLMEVLDWHADAHGERPHLLLLGEGEEPETLTHAQLRQGAGQVAGALAARGLGAGERVAIMLPTGRGYFLSFFGILLAGGVPVPIYPPARPSQLEDHLRRHAGILASAGTRMLITVPEARTLGRLLQAQVPGLSQVLDWQELATGSDQPTGASRASDDIAFLQYTSGSTGDPKGVILTHAQLLANVRAMGAAVEAGPQDVFVSWLPLYHDMGLIGAWFGSLYFGMPLVVMSPLHFLARPARWLWAIHRHRGTLSAAPNFAYELCLTKVQPEEIQGLDLSSWRWAFNGAEPVSPATLRRFGERFAPYGFDARALAPVYGLAEVAVGLAFPPPGRGARLDRIRRQPFMAGGQALPAPNEAPDALELVACGRPMPGYQARVVDANGAPLPERREGRLEIQGPSVTSGYFGNPDATARLFRDGWLDTGDRAYLADGDIYITGRAKEMMIRAGRNLYPYELEQAVGGLPGVRKGCVAVFASPDPASGAERLVVVAETREREAAAREQLRSRIQVLAVDLLGIPADVVELVPPHRVLKTSSGKVRRGAVRTLYEQGRLGRGSGALGWQLSRVLASALAARLGIWFGEGRELAYAAYAWTCFGVLTPLVWLGVVLLPVPAWRWAWVRGAIRLLRVLTGVGLTVEGLARLPGAGQAYVLVANHASYLDSIALIDAIPHTLHYVAKRELRDHWFSRWFLERLGTRFVERLDPRQGTVAAQEFSPLLKSGQALAFFPEGTFRAGAGLLPFRLGAFAAAAEAGVPVLPVAILGSRALLPGDCRRPRRGPLRLVIGTALTPDGTDWAAAVRLRDQARRQILDRVGEPDLGQG